MAAAEPGRAGSRRPQCRIAKFGGSDGVRQVVVELDDLLLFASSAGWGSVLTVLADRDADPGVVGYEMSQFIKSVRPFLATPARGAAP